MELIQRIEHELLASLRSREMIRTSALRMLKHSLKNFAIAKRVSETSLSDEQVVQIVRQEAKKRKESMEAFESGGRNDLAEKERQELAILESYLPPQLGDAELRRIIMVVVDELELKPPYRFGSLMGAVVKQVAGKADGQTVKKAVEQFINEAS